MTTDLTNRINNSKERFSKGQRSIADYIIKHYAESAYMTASQLGKAAKVSESTVVRFATELGYEGFPEMKVDLIKSLSSYLTSAQRVAITNDHVSDSEVLTKTLRQDAARIQQTLNIVDIKAFNRSVEAILNARTIYVIGMRSSAILAEFLEYSFRFMLTNVHLVSTTTGSEIFEQLININSNDVLIGISFPRYASRMINAVHFANSAKAKVIAITDSKDSPIADSAYAVLEARSDMVSFSDSLVAPLSIINALIVALGKKKQTEVSEALQKLEDLWDKYGVYDKAAKNSSYGK